MTTPSTLVADRYRLVKMLGAGGMGIVWHAWDERLQRAVALKMLRAQPELTDSERQLATERAMREARITAGLHHPHAVTVFDVIEHDGRPCIVMELIESTPLSVLLTEHGPLTSSQTAHIAAQVSSALAAAHKLRIVHRDVKPGNILITADGSAMISDFGISHALGDATITATGLIHGTPAYLAPEVARGLPTSFASDVFSLGSTMYAMLEGSPPFGADKNAISLLHRVARGGYPPPRHAGALAPLLREMLSTNPKRRPGMASITASLWALQEREGRAAPAPDGVAVLIELLNGGEAGENPAGSATGAVVRHQLSPHTIPVQDAPTEAIDRDPATPPTVAVDGPPASPPQFGAATAKTLPADLPTRYQPPTVETEPLRPARGPVSAVDHPTRHGRRRTMIAGILTLVGALVLGAALVFNPWRSNDGDARGPEESAAPVTTPVTQTPEAGDDAPRAPSDSTPPPEEAGPEPPPATPEQRVIDMVSGYYAVLPSDLDAAWPLMTADYQENHAGGRGAYEAFWSQIADVEITGVSATAPDRAEATLTYRFNDGRVVQEVTSYRLVDEGGTLKIAETDVLSSSQL